MKTLQDYINSDLLNWLHDNNFKHKRAKIKTDKGLVEIYITTSFV
jgi:hypothetical protein